MVSEKKLVEDVSGWLRLYDDGSVDRTWTGPPQIKFMAEPVPPHDHFIDGVAVRDVTTDQKSGNRVRIYLPETNPEETKHKLPVMLHFHGGGFCISQADWYMYYCFYTELSRAAKAIIVSVYLPLAPENRLPAAVEESYSALVWLSSLSQGKSHDPWLLQYANFSRVFLIGDSSGGNLVHQVAVRAEQENLSPLKLAGGIPIHPGFVRAERSRSELEQPQSPFLTLDMLDKFLCLGLPIGSTKDDPITCPMGAQAPPLKSMKLPPILLCIAEKDLIVDTEMEFYEAMKKANKEIEVFINPRMTHSFYLNKIAVDMDPDTAAQTSGLIDGIVEFINKH